MSNIAIKIRTLGGLEFVRSDNRVLTFHTRKSRALLLYLSCNSGKSFSREHLACLFWERSADEQARASLRQTLSSLKKSLDDIFTIIEIEGEDIRVSTDKVSIDCDQFESLLKQSDSKNLDVATSLYGGGFLQGFELRERGFEDWLLSRRTYYQELAIRGLLKLANVQLQNGQTESAIDTSRRALEIDPLLEDAHRVLMRSLAVDGRSESALQQYENCKNILNEQLNVWPSSDTRQLAEQIQNNSFSEQGEKRYQDQADSSEIEKTISERPVIAVLPFENRSNEPDQEYFSEGITDDIITELSRFRSLSVLGRSTSSFIRGSKNLNQIRNTLGVNYLVEGSVRRSDHRIRITAQLTDTRSGKNIWAQKYDHKLRDIFDVQDEVVQTIVATVGGRLEHHRGEIVRQSSINDWGVYDLILQAQHYHYRIVKSDNIKSTELLHEALQRDPDNSRAHSLLGATHLLAHILGWTEDPQGSLDEALVHGRKSIQLDSTDSLAHARLGETLIHFEKLEESEFHFNKAIELNPNDSESLALYSTYYMAMGDEFKALEKLKAARTIDPYDRVWIPWLHGEALFAAGQYRDAIRAFEEVSEPINDLKLTLAACYSMIDNLARASSLLEDYLQIAEQEMPLFPGRSFSSDWQKMWQLGASLKQSDQQMLLSDALKKAWPA